MDVMICAAMELGLHAPKFSRHDLEFRTIKMSKHGDTTCMEVTG